MRERGINIVFGVLFWVYRRMVALLEIRILGEEEVGVGNGVLF